MLITGYHGTTASYAHSIILEGKFHVSNGNKEWLGNGIYFYEKFSDAYNWRPASGERKEVLHSVIEISDDEYLDIESPEGIAAWEGILTFIRSTGDVELTGTYQENQCAVCNMIWDTSPDIKVLAASFATVPMKEKLLIDTRPRRREMCVRGNEQIKCTQIVEYRG